MPSPTLSRLQKQKLLSLAVIRAKQFRTDKKLDIVEQYRGDELGFIVKGLKQCQEDSWRTWRIVLKAAYGKQLDPDELSLFREIAHRDPPTRKVKELWLVIGARGGKDSIASVIAAQASCYADEGISLRPGEHALVACFANDRRQAQIVYNYTKAYFEQIPSLRKRVISNLTSTPQPIVLCNSTEIAVVSNTFRAPRGWPIACAIFDECLSAGTLIQTKNGEKLIEDVKIGDLVWTRKGFKPVVESKLTNKSASLWKIKFNNGTELVGTLNHPIFVFGKGFTSLKELQKGDEVFQWQRRWLSGIINNGFLVKTGITETFQQENFSIGKFTCQFMDLFHLIFMFTTKTKINKIFLLIIWKLLHLLNIYKFMNREAFATQVLKNGSFGQKSGGITENLLNEFAFAAGKLFFLPVCVLNFVMETAKQNVKDKKIQKSIIKERWKDITRRKKVLVESVSDLMIEDSVYNLQIKDCPEYFANGILVHNCAFWRDENSANPDKETYIAVLRGSSANTVIVGISTPYKRSGLLYERWKEYAGKNDDDVLVIKAPTLTFRPNFDQSIIARAKREDPERAKAEYDAEWRDDIADYVNRDVAEACTVKERFELPRQYGIKYHAFVDPSGGSVDSMTLAIAHREGKGVGAKGILDLIREIRAPFSPEHVVEEFSIVLRNYGINRVVGDHYAGEWPRERFAFKSITYILSERTKSDIYREFLPHLNTRRVELLDIKRLIDQLCGLERRAIRGGRDTIDHAQEAHDDVINSAAGALLLAVEGANQPTVISPEVLAKSRAARVH